MADVLAGAATAAPKPTGHSPYGASGAHRWTVCHGSIRAQHGQPDDESPYAKEGTALHAVAALCLENGQDAIEYVDRTIEGVEIDDDHAEAVQVYLDTIRDDQKARGGKLLIETRFHLEHLHPLFFGTADCVRIGLDGVMTVYDAKFGRGKIVEVADDMGFANIQLGYYALGALHACGRVVAQLDVQRIELVVVQPRAWHAAGSVRRRTFSRSEIEQVGAALVKAAKLCEAPDAILVPGDHCTFCKAAGSCKALRNQALEIAQLDFDDETGLAPAVGARVPDVDAMTPQQLAHVLDAADLVETFIKAARARAHILAGTAAGMPGWKLVDKQARRKWEDEAKAAAELSLVYGLDESSIHVKKLLSPAQIEKLLPKPERPLLAALYSAKSSGSTLVRASNPRPERIPVQADFDDGLSTGETAEW